MLPRRRHNLRHWRNSRPTKKHRHRRHHHDPRLSTAVHSLHARAHHCRQNRLRMRHGLHQFHRPGLPVGVLPESKQGLVRLYAAFNSEFRYRSCLLDRLCFLHPHRELCLAYPSDSAMRLPLSYALHHLNIAGESTLARCS